MDLINEKVVPPPKRDEMIDIIRSKVRETNKVESISFTQCANRIAAEDIYSKNTLPNSIVSRFDGIAVKFSDFAKGIPDSADWECGKEYVFSNTGIAISENFDTVIPIEEVTILDKGIKINKAPETKGEFVNAAGGNFQNGELLISKDERITHGHIGLFASGGVLEVLVKSKPSIAIIPTGDELINPTTLVPMGKNIDSNSYMISSYISMFGGESNIYPITKDDKTELKDTVSKALSENDAAIIIAGSSLGTKDFTISILSELGEVIVQELAHGPGRKSSFSIVENKPVFGIAGPPLGAQIVCDLYVQTFVNALAGRIDTSQKMIEVIVDDDFMQHEVDFNERVHIYKSADAYHARALFKHKLSRPQMQALANGNYYRKAGTSKSVGDTETVELLCSIDEIPQNDKTSEVIERRKNNDE